MWGPIWREAVREVQTTVGRRRSRFAGSDVQPQSTLHALVVEEEEDGCVIIGKAERRPPTAEVPLSDAVSSTPYLVGGEAGVAEEEDEEYRRLWNLPQLRSRAAVASPPGSEAAPAPSAAASSTVQRPTAPSHGDPSPAAGSEHGGRTAAMPHASPAPPTGQPPTPSPPADSAAAPAVSAADGDGGVGHPGPEPLMELSSSADSELEGEAAAAAHADSTAWDWPRDAHGAGAAAGSRDARRHPSCAEVRPAGPTAAPRSSGLSGTCQMLARLLASLSGWVLKALHHGSMGLWQAHRPKLVYHYVVSDPLSRKCMGQCLLLDACLFRGALLFYERALPLICSAVLGVELRGDARYELALTCLWTVPAYIVCEIVSTSWHYRMYQQMAQRKQRESGTEHRAGRPSATLGGARSAEATSSSSAASPPANPNPPRSGVATSSVFEMVYTRLVYIAFLLQLRLLCSLPYGGSAATLVLSALLHAYDCFELCWGCAGLGVSQRFRLIERHWLFFFGYGGVLATLSVLLSFWDLFVVRAVLYPLYIANAPHARFEKLQCHPLPAFQASFGVINSALQLAELRMRRRRTPA